MTLARWEDMFDLLDAHQTLWSPLRASALLTQGEGRPRRPGEWALAYLAYANSAEPDLLRWHRAAPPELWQRAGFAKPPSYHSTYETFIVLEAHEAVFRAVAAELVKVAVKASSGKVGHALHVDGTEAETHSRLIHDCGGRELTSCKRQMSEPRRASPSDARDERHLLAIQAPDDEQVWGAAEKMAADERGLRVQVGGCWYRLSDADAGIRAYTRDGKIKKFWSGYYNLKATDHYTGAVLAVHVCSASTQEHNAYPTLYKQAKEAIGSAPRAVVADRGFSVSSVFEAHTRDGVASVIPWRKTTHESVRIDRDRYDRHGIPRCQHCGSECSFHRFNPATGPNQEPRLWFRCTRPGAAACQQEQSILCKENWRSLLPLWRTTEAYQVLRVSHDNYENAHHRWRERYAVAGDSRADRPKRRGLGVQQLRASAALVIEWLTVCHRQGWLPGSVAINTDPEMKLSSDEAASYTSRILRTREDAGLSVTSTAGLLAHQAEIAEARERASEAIRKGHKTIRQRQAGARGVTEGPRRR